MQKYINPLTDFGFQKLFATEDTTIVTSFLNDLLELDSPIVNVELEAETFPIVLPENNQTFLQLSCTNFHGEHFVILLYKSGHHLIREYLMYYVSALTNYLYPLGENGGYTFKKIYAIGMINFKLFTDHRYLRTISLQDNETQEILSNSSQYVFLEMPKFQKTDHQLKKPIDKWLFLIKNIANNAHFESVVQYDHILQKAVEHLTLSNLSETEYVSYLASIKEFHDHEAEIELAKYKGIEQGVLREKLEIAKRMLAKHIDISDIVDITNLSAEQIQQMVKKID